MNHRGPFPPSHAPFSHRYWLFDSAIYAPSSPQRPGLKSWCFGYFGSGNAPTPLEVCRIPVETGGFSFRLLLPLLLSCPGLMHPSSKDPTFVMCAGSRAFTPKLRVSSLYTSSIATTTGSSPVPHLTGEDEYRAGLQQLKLRWSRNSYE